MDLARSVPISPEEKAQAIKMVGRVKPGDIILLRTPASLYDTARWLLSTPYDHAVIVVDEERSLHISYPRAKLVPTYLFTHIKR